MKTRLLLSAIAVSAAMPILASNIKIFILKELVDKADAIVVATMASEDGEPVANIQRTIKGTVGEKSVRLRTRFVWEHPSFEFRDGERAVLFLQSAGPDGVWGMVGHGDQGKWPKIGGDWPCHSPAHTSSVEWAEAAVTGFVRVRGNKAESEAFVKGLLRSGQVFDQLTAIECLASPEFTDLRDDLAADIAALAESPDAALSRNAGRIKWQMESEAREREREARIKEREARR